MGYSDLGVQSRHLVDRIEDESVWLRSPDFGDVFVGSEAVDRLEAPDACSRGGRPSRW